MGAKIAFIIILRYIDMPKDKTWALFSILFFTDNVLPHPRPPHPTYNQHSARGQKPPPHPNRSIKTAQTKKPTAPTTQTWDEAPQPHPSPQNKKQQKSNNKEKLIANAEPKKPSLASPDALMMSEGATPLSNY